MLVKKLAVPLVNEKLLQQAEHLYVATASVSDDGFEFIRSRIPPKCRIELVTNLHGSSPTLFEKILKHYRERFDVRIYTKSRFEANLYIIDLPFRKSVAFVGSGTLSAGGLKDFEHIFYRVTDAKEIENLKSWFIGYFEYAVPVTERIAASYKVVQPWQEQRSHRSHAETDDVIALNAGGFSLENVRYKNQYFQKEDFEVLSFANAESDNPIIVEARRKIVEKLLHLHSFVKSLRDTNFAFTECKASEVDASSHPENRVKVLRLTYTRRVRSIEKISSTLDVKEFFFVRLMVSHGGFSIALGADGGEGGYDRALIQRRIQNASFIESSFQALKSLPDDYYITTGFETKQIRALSTSQQMADLFQKDNAKYGEWYISCHFRPGDPRLSAEQIGGLVEEVVGRFAGFYDSAMVGNEG